MPELPDGVTVERVFLAEIPYTPEAPQRRPAVRHEHLERAGRLTREGRLVVSGGCADFSKAVLLIRVATEAEALAIIDEDVYTRAGVWTSPVVTPYNLVVFPAAA